MLILDPTLDQRDLNTSVDPVKWIPERLVFFNAISVIITGSPVTRFITPLGRPASLNTSIITFALYTWWSLGFHKTTFPIRAALAHRFPPIAVKLNGVIA